MLFFYGPPGSGKTLAAQHIAFASNCDFALVSGGSLISLGKRGSHELTRLLKWAKRRATNQKPLVLFIDECEALSHCGRESKNNEFAMTEGGRSTMSTFLAETGGYSSNLMLILATNVPHTLDPAVKDRMDIQVHFDFPSENEREAKIREMFRIWSPEPSQKGFLSNIPIINNCLLSRVQWPFSSILFRARESPKSILEQDLVDRLVAETKGMSFRQVEKYILGQLSNDLLRAKEDVPGNNNLSKTIVIQVPPM